MKELTPELERKNLALGWALFGICLLLFAGTIGIALLYFADWRKIEIRGADSDRAIPKGRSRPLAE